MMKNNERRLSKNKKAISLLSTGLDSPVATYLIAQQGIEVVGVYFDNHPFIASTRNGKKRQEELPKANRWKDIKAIAQTLVNKFTHQKLFDLFIVPHGENLGGIIRQASDPKVTCVLCKRLMLKKTVALANTIGTTFLVTGDILGEQASQTIENLRIISEVIPEMTVIRPNIGLNKLEVITIAREIGTYQHAAQAAKKVCTAVPKKPVTRTTSDRIEAAEARVPIKEWVKESIMNAVKLPFQQETRE
ncbi:MAG: hypothetical protein GF308_04045 [Candidatus Heimdallarchaeota archaeon]|nr:hypothetical protein [Candidatus Heimdallarchaeota archaeon]